MKDQATNSNTNRSAGLVADGDDFYQMLIDAHQGLEFEQSCSLNARLVLLFANEIGDIDRLRHLVDLAGQE